MTEVYLIEGIKGSGKSKRIHTLKEKYIKAGYKLTDSKWKSHATLTLLAKQNNPPWP